MGFKVKLEKFRDLKIFKDQLSQEMHARIKISHPIQFNYIHVINALEQYQANKIPKQQLVDWVNLLWFWDEWYSFPRNQAECLASVLDELEELDEREGELEEEKINEYMYALKNNVDISVSSKTYAQISNN